VIKKYLDLDQSYQLYSVSRLLAISKIIQSHLYYYHVAAVAGGIQACTENGTVPQIIRQCKLSATAALTLQL